MGALADFRTIQGILGVDQDGRLGDETRTAFVHLGRAALQELKAAEQSAAHTGETASPEEAGRVDARSEGNIATLHPKVRPLARQLVRAAAAEKLTIVVTSGTRTYAEQDALFAQGRTKAGSRVTNARGGFSNHNFGIAFDVTLFKDMKPVWESPAYRRVGQLGKALGLDWGGDWASPVDEPHFELHPDWAEGLRESVMIAGLRARVAAGKDVFA